jgi:hypothetical protein
MSSNSTVIPGLQGQPQSSTGGFASNPYPNPAQPFGIPAPGQDTVIPGLGERPGEPRSASQGQVFGFLFSVSKTLAGEYWPILLGGNTIGRGPGNSIQLGEMTVSDNHAVIHVISRANKLIAYIKDDKSKTGTLLNGELLRGEADLKSGDIITIGERYELLVILINAVDLGLKVNPDFAPTNVAPATIPAQTTPFGQMPGNFRPQMGSATVAEGQSGPIPVGGHTVIMGGNK